MNLDSCGIDIPSIAAIIVNTINASIIVKPDFLLHILSNSVVKVRFFRNYCGLIGVNLGFLKRIAILASGVAGI